MQILQPTKRFKTEKINTYVKVLLGMTVNVLDILPEQIWLLIRAILTFLGF